MANARGASEPAPADPEPLARGGAGSPRHGDGLPKNRLAMAEPGHNEAARVCPTEQFEVETEAEVEDAVRDLGQRWLLLMGAVFCNIYVGTARTPKHADGRITQHTIQCSDCGWFNPHSWMAIKLVCAAGFAYGNGTSRVDNVEALVARVVVSIFGEVLDNVNKLGANFSFAENGTCVIYLIITTHPRVPRGFRSLVHNLRRRGRDAFSLRRDAYSLRLDAYSLGHAKHNGRGPPENREFNLRHFSEEEVLAAYHRVYDLRTPGVTHRVGMFTSTGTYMKMARAASGSDNYPPNKTHVSSKKLYEALPAFLASLRRQAAIRAICLVFAVAICLVFAVVIIIAAGRLYRSL